MYEQTMNNDVTLTGGENPLLAGRYQVVRQLGTGGMGSVWLAEDRQLDNKLFAVKMLPSVLVSNKRAYRQLKDEALVAMKLTHPNIVTLRAFEENNGNPFLVMDYIEGRTLDDYLAEVGNGEQGTGNGRAQSPSAPQSTYIPEADVVRILTPIAAALDYAHSKGVVHRDVKPGNVMIAKDGTPYILDFGIAREIQETMTRVTGKLSSGTLLYMSPEQLRGQPPKAAQDVYSFAAMAYECLKGEPPFSRGQIEYQILNEQPERLSDDIRISASIMRGLSKVPEARPDSCAKVLLAAPTIRRMPPARPQVAVPPRPTAPMADRIVVRQKRNIAGVVVPLSCLIVAILVLGGVLWHREAQRQENARRLAEEQQREELRRRQDEEERKAQEAAARKKAEAERLAMLQQEEAQRKAEEDAKRREAEEAKEATTALSDEAKEQLAKVEAISDADGFKERKDSLSQIFARAEIYRDDKVKRWEEAAELYRDYVKGSKELIILDEQRQRAVSQRDEARKSFKAAEDAGAKTYAKESWNAAVKTWRAAAVEFSSNKFAIAAIKFDEAQKEFDGCYDEARNKKRIEDRNAELLRLEKERAAERQRKLERYASVKVGSLVQISTDANDIGRLGIVVANENGEIRMSHSIGSITVKSVYPYDDIANLIVRGDVDENAIMRANLVGRWTGTTKYGTAGADVDMNYEYIFNADGSAVMKDSNAFQSRSSETSNSGKWEVEGKGAVLKVRLTSGPSAGKTWVFNLVKHSNDQIEFRWDIDTLKDIAHKGFFNTRHWYDASGVYHFEGDCKSGWSTYHVSNTETPRIMRRHK